MTWAFLPSFDPSPPFQQNSALLQSPSPMLATVNSSLLRKNSLYFWHKTYVSKSLLFPYLSPPLVRNCQLWAKPLWHWVNLIMLTSWLTAPFSRAKIPLDHFGLWYLFSSTKKIILVTDKFEVKIGWGQFKVLVLVHQKLWISKYSLYGVSTNDIQAGFFSFNFFHH